MGPCPIQWDLVPFNGTLSHSMGPCPIQWDTLNGTHRVYIECFCAVLSGTRAVLAWFAMLLRLSGAAAPLVRRCSTRVGPAGTKAFVESEMPAIVDLFSAFALPGQSELDAGGLQKVLAAVGEHPSPETLRRMFVEADTDRSGTIDLAEFLAASDRILGQSPARTILVVGGPGSGKGVLCERLKRECATSHVSCGEMLREEVQRATPLGLQAG